MKITQIILATIISISSCVIAGAAPDFAVLPAPTRGIVLFPDGKTPVDDLIVRIWDADTEQIIARMKTNRDGIFQIPQLNQGDHYVSVGPVRIDMRVLGARTGIIPQPHGIVIVVPKRMPAVRIPFVVPGVSLSAVTIPEIISPLVPGTSRLPDPTPKIMSP